MRSADRAFALPEIRAGTLADAATLKLPRRIPYHIAMEMLLLGRWMDAQEAQRWGLVNDVLADEAQLMDRVWDIARTLENGPPLVFAAIKEVARDAAAMTFQDGMNRITRRQFETVDTLYDSEDLREGFNASPKSATRSGGGGEWVGWRLASCVEFCIECRRRYTETKYRDSKR